MSAVPQAMIGFAGVLGFPATAWICCQRITASQSSLQKRKPNLFCRQLVPKFFCFAHILLLNQIYSSSRRIVLNNQVSNVEKQRKIRSRCPFAPLVLIVYQPWQPRTRRHHLPSAFPFSRETTNKHSFLPLLAISELQGSRSQPADIQMER